MIYYSIFLMLQVEVYIIFRQNKCHLEQSSERSMEYSKKDSL